MKTLTRREFLSAIPVVALCGSVFGQLKDRNRRYLRQYRASAMLARDIKDMEIDLRAREEQMFSVYGPQRVLDADELVISPKR